MILNFEKIAARIFLTCCSYSKDRGRRIVSLKLVRPSRCPKQGHPAPSYNLFQYSVLYVQTLVYVRLVKNIWPFRLALALISFSYVFFGQ